MKCQRRILRISWQQVVRNEEVRTQTGLSSMLDIISRRRISIFRHIARLQDSVPGPQGISCSCQLVSWSTPDSCWRRTPGRPHGRWLDQIRMDTGQTPADHWRQAQRRGHRRGEGMLRPTMATRRSRVPTLFLTKNSRTFLRVS